MNWSQLNWGECHRGRECPIPPIWLLLTHWLKGTENHGCPRSQQGMAQPELGMWCCCDITAHRTGGQEDSTRSSHAESHSPESPKDLSLRCHYLRSGPVPPCGLHTGSRQVQEKALAATILNPLWNTQGYEFLTIPTGLASLCPRTCLQHVSASGSAHRPRALRRPHPSVSEDDS